MDARKVGHRLVELCKQGQYIEAIDELYGDEVENVEAAAMPGYPQRLEGKAAVRAHNVQWMEGHEFHGGTVDGPHLHGDRLAVVFTMDMTAKAGPRAGKRMQGTEVGVYHVADGKIDRIEWFYDMGDECSG